VNNYLVDGVGLFDVTTNLDMTSGAAASACSGRVAARSRRITNETSATCSAASARITANIVMDPSGLVIGSATSGLAAPRRFA
jgi:translocation and assembly module TamB